MILKPLDICGPCTLYGNGMGFSRPEGTGRTGVLIVGDSLGQHEEDDGLPFRPRSQAGGVLERVIRRGGFVRDDFRIWNTIGCAPPPGYVSIEGQSWEDDVVERCRSHFRRVVEEFRPKCILALGSVALKALTGFSGSKDMRIGALRGFVLDSEYCPVVATYHPAYLRRGSSKSREKGTGAKTKGTTGPGMALLGVLIHDMKRAVAVANGSWTTWDTQPEFSGYLDGYQTQPTIQDARDLLDRAYKNPDLMIGFDLEHPKKAEDPDEESDKEEMEWLTDVGRTVRDGVHSLDAIGGGNGNWGRTDSGGNGDIHAGQEIYSAQFSICKGTGIYFPWIGEFIQIAAELLALPNLKSGHYARVNDNPRLATWGIQVREPFIDTWELFHHLQPDIPAPLQFVASFAGFPFPWKHWRQVNPEWYGIADVDALHYIVPWALKALEGLGLRGQFTTNADGRVSVSGYEQVRRLGPVFANMTRRGIPVNEERRKEFRLELDKERARMRTEIQALVPDAARTVRKIGKDAAKYYQRPPATVRLALINNPNIARVDGEDGVTYVREDIVEPAIVGSLRFGNVSGTLRPDSTDAMVSPVTEDRGQGRKQACKPFQAALWDEAQTGRNGSSDARRVRDGHKAVQAQVPDSAIETIPSRWYALEPFNPSSPAQILAYCRAKGYEPPADRYGNRTTAAYELERLGRKTKDPIFKMILESREVVTMGGTFVDGWAPDADGRVHPRFYVAPGTGQHSSRRPNAQNSPVHTRLASAFQNIIEASPGHTLIKFDWKSFHSVMFAFESQDQTYMRLARMDPHSFLTAHMCNLPEKDRLLAMPDDELRDRLKYIRSCGNHLDPVTNECTRHSWAEKNAGKCWQYVRDSRAKPGGFGWLLGMRERTLWEQNRDAFDRIQDAKRVLDMLNRTFPKCREFQRQVQLVAHKRGRLVSRWGFVRWFWEVFKYDYATGENPPGDDSEAAIAFLIQNDAHGYRNAVMVEAEERGWNEKFWLINEVHDDLRFDCPDEHVEECKATIKSLMERPRPELVCPVTAPDGLSVACSVATGKRLSELH